MPERGRLAEPARLTLLAHPPTARASLLVFGDRSAALRPRRRPDLLRGVAEVRFGPESPCRAALDASPGRTDPRLAGPDLGRWAGRTLTEVAADDPVGLQAWLTDVDAAPHGGESLASLVARLAPLPAEVDAGRAVWAVTPLVARALTVAALGAPAALLLALEVGFDDAARLARASTAGGAGPGWRLQGLARAAAVGVDAAVDVTVDQG